MTTAEKIAVFEMVLSKVSEDDYLIMAGWDQIYGIDSRGNPRFLHLTNKYEDGALVALPLRLAKRTCEWMGGQPVRYRTWLEVELKRLKNLL